MLWNLIALATACATLLLTLRAARTLDDLRTLFVIIAIWARYVLQAYPEHTTDPLVAGFSLSSLSSVAVATVGIALVAPASLLQCRLRLLPLVLLLVVIVFSGLLNLELRGLIKDSIKWLYFTAIALLLYRSFVKFDPDVVLRSLFCATLTPLILQWFSVLLGRSTVDASLNIEGSVSYIGGYGGQAGFSVVLFTLLCISSLIKWRNQLFGLLMIPICIFGIYLSNYRTSIIASLPLIAAVLSIFLLKNTPQLLRPVTLFYLAGGAACVAVLAALFTPAAYLDIVTVVSEVGELFRPPDLYTEEQADLFSGRLYLWALYIWDWLNASTAVHFFGFGPEAWEGVQPKYAHNTFVSYLYEFGVVGTFFLLVFFASQILLAMLVRPVDLAVRLVAAICGFVILNLATMPLWLIEGLIVLAILCARTWASVEGVRVGAPRAQIGKRWHPTASPSIGSKWASSETRSVRRQRAVGADEPTA